MASCDYQLVGSDNSAWQGAGSDASGNVRGNTAAAAEAAVATAVDGVVGDGSCHTNNTH